MKIPLGRKQRDYAAKLYSLSLIAHLDCGGCDNDDEMRVVERAFREARRELARMGHDYSSLPSLAGCIEVARRKSLD